MAFILLGSMFTYDQFMTPEQRIETPKVASINPVDRVLLMPQKIIGQRFALSSGFAF